jgi:tetratricopeptide (TPR) repeat protein
MFQQLPGMGWWYCPGHPHSRCRATGTRVEPAGPTITPMRRSLLLLNAALLAVLAVLALDRIDRDWRYQQLLAEGDRLMTGGERGLAIAAYSSALSLRPDSMLGHYRRGEAYGAEGQPTQALRDLRAAARLAPDAPEPREAIGQLHARNGNHAASALWYREAATRRGDAAPHLLYALAVAYYRTGALLETHNTIQAALARDPAMAAGHYLEGLVARDLGDYQRAVTSLEFALRLDASLAAARHELASVRSELGDRRGRAADLETLGGGAAATTNRAVAAALAYLEAGDVMVAVIRLSAIARAAPNDSRVALALGRAHLAAAAETGDAASLTAARQAIERALGGTASRSEGLTLYARLLDLEGRADEAERLLRDALRARPVFTPAYAALADVAARLGHHRIARDALVTLTAFDGSSLRGPALQARRQRIGELSLQASGARTAATYRDDTGLPASGLRIDPGNAP